MECSLEPFIKLNTNDSSLGNPGLANVRGLLCNSSRDWISGFSLHMVLLPIILLSSVWFSTQTKMSLYSTIQ